MKKQMKLVLLVAMIAVMLVMTAMFASAAEHEWTPGASFPSAADGDTIVITGEHTLTADLTISKSLTFKGTGTIDAKTFSIIVGGAKILTIDGGSYVSSGNLLFKVSAGNSNGLVINDGTFTYNDNGLAASNVRGMVYLSDGTASVTINGGSFSSNAAHPFVVKRNGTLTINSGTFTHSGSGDIVWNPAGFPNGAITVTGGTFNHTGTGSAIKIESPATFSMSGATFSTVEAALAGPYFAEVFEVNGVAYYWGEALAKVSDGGTITVTGTYDMAVVINKNVTLVGDGHLAKGATVSSGTVVFGGNLNITGTVTVSGGTLTMQDNVVLKGSVYIGAATVTIKGNVSVSNASYTHSSNACGLVLFLCNSATSRLYIQGGTFAMTGNKHVNSSATGTADAAGSNGSAMIVTNDGGGATVEISGGTFTMSGQGDLLMKRGGYAKISGGTFVHNGLGSIIQPMAKTGDNDIIISGGTFSNVSDNTEALIHLNQATSVLITGGTFTNNNKNGEGSDYGLIRMNDGYASLTIQGGTFISNSTAILLHKGDGVLKIEKANGAEPTFTQNKAGYVINANSANGSTSISAGTFTGGISWVHMNNIATIDISGGTFSGLTGGRGIWLRNASYDNGKYTSATAVGKLNITGGSFTVEENSGAAIFFNCAGADVNVSGGTFVSEKKDIPIFNIADKDCVSNVTISGGTFTTTQAHVVAFTAGQRTDRPQGDLTITGGTMNVGNGYNGIYITHEGESGVVNIENVTIKPTDPTTSCNPVVVGNANVTVNIKSGSYDSNHSGAAIWINSAKAVNITGGTFEGWRTMNVYKCNAVTISGGTFSHNVQDHNGEDQTTSVGIHLREEGAEVTILGGEFVGKGDGITVNAGSVYVMGGTFTMSGNAAVGVNVGNGFAAVSNGVFTMNDNGYAVGTFVVEAKDAASQLAPGTLNVFGGTFDGDGGKLWMAGAAEVNLSGDIVFEAATTANNNIHVANASAGGTLTISGGTYYSGKSSVINAAGANVIITDGIFESNKNIIVVGDNDYTSGITVLGGEFNLTDAGASVFYANQAAGERAETGKIMGSVAIDGGIYNIGEGKLLSITFGKLIPFSVTVGDVDVTGEGECIIYLAVASTKANITFNGGTYTLTSEDGCIVKLANGSYWYANSEDSFTNDEGVTDEAALNAWLELYNKYGKTFKTGANITFNGTTLLDKSAAGEAVIDATDIASTIAFNDCTFLCKTMKAYFLATGDAETSAPMSNAVPTVVYGDETYYTWQKLAATDAAIAPTTVKGASVRVTVGSQGIRFTTKISADVMQKLEALGTVTYGTLIAPADVVLKAGAFTIEALTAYAAENFEGDATKVFVNIPAVNSLERDVINGVTFNGVLANVKESNYNRGMAAVGYACVNGTYYYAAYDCTVNARTMSDIAAAAIADVVEEPAGEYIHLIDGKYSRYTQAQIDALKAYLPAA